MERGFPFQYYEEEEESLFSGRGRESFVLRTGSSKQIGRWNVAGNGGGVEGGGLKDGKEREKDIYK